MIVKSEKSKEASAMKGPSYAWLTKALSFSFKAPVYDWNPQIQGIIFSAINYGMILTLASVTLLLEE